MGAPVALGRLRMWQSKQSINFAQMSTNVMQMGKIARICAKLLKMTNLGA
jgi:hypothetical protein